MKILHVISSIAPRTGGPARAVLGLAGALQAEGHDVTIFSTDFGISKSQDEDFLRDQSVEIKLFPMIGPSWYYYSAPLKRALEASVRSFDLVHIHGVWTYPTLVASRLAWRNQIPYVIRPCGMLTDYCFAYHEARKRLYHLLFERENIKNAAHIQYTTEVEQSQSLRFAGQIPSTVIPVGLDSEINQALTSREVMYRAFARLRGKKVILYLGRLTFKKGLYLLVEAFGKLFAERQDIHLVIAGPDDLGEARELDARIDLANCRDGLTKSGFIDGELKQSLLLHCDIFCLPSYHESLGLSILEAMTAARPIIVSDQVQIHKEISAAEAGLVVPCRARELRDALATLLDDANLRHALGCRGQELVCEQFMWSRIVNEVIGLYERVLGRSENKEEKANVIAFSR